MRNWKTTALGFVAAVLQLMAGGMNAKTAASAAAIALLGTVAKDYDVSHTQP